ncbi:MAG: zinc ribbon domain-containing protein [Gemmatimonadetes bacterium]|nr:zinc ribbon domain-containing protein [Gemmatimonadota bacterium]
MPTYHYVCPKCGNDFDVFDKKISDRPKTRKCPTCGGRARRQISGGAGFLFKGEGFYQTDYRSQEYASKAKAEKDSASGSSETSGKKDESKTEKNSKETSGESKGE